jgi:hypothetical protein
MGELEELFMLSVDLWIIAAVPRPSIRNIKNHEIFEYF